MTATGLLAFLRFETPGYLVLLALLPLIVVLSIRSLAGLGRVRRVLAIAARCLVILCMTLALAGAQRTETTDEVAVIFVLDRSNSIPRPYQEEAFEFVRAAEQGRRSDDRMGVVAFDGKSAVEQLPMGTLAIDKVTEPVAPHETDLAAGLRLAMALFPPDAARRVVLLSDGNENVGGALGEAEHFRAAGVPIDVVPILYEHANEVVFEQLRAPPTAAADETINLQMVLRSQERVSGRIMLEHNGQLIDAAPDSPETGFRVVLEPGANRFPVPVPLRAAGVHRFRAYFEPDNPDLDTVAANNVGESFTIVSGQGKVLILTSEEDEAEGKRSARILARALEREKLVCDVEVAGANPLDQVRLLEYSAVIISNVAAGDFAEYEQKVLEVYVRDLGGGLIMIGGEYAFGAGGWLGSPVEDIMPVSFDVKNLKQLPKGALVLVMHACEVPQGNFIGERCAVNAAKTLSSRDLIGILSWQWGGTEKGYWVVELQPVGDKRAILQSIKKMQMGDMPDLDEVMRPGVEALVQATDASVKHMIVVSDFDPAPPAGDLIKTMQDNAITCSTIAIGYGGHWIDEGKARWIAQSSGGRFYSTQDYAKLPQIFVKESRIVQRSLINENPFQPRLVNRLSQVVAGLSPEGIPPLGGFVVTTAKPLAEVPLVRSSQEESDPVLAHWQVGLGKTVAFTSGLWSRWGADWAGWEQFSKFWAQTVRWTSRQAESAALDVTTSVQGGRGKIRIDALDKNADAVDFMQIQGFLVTPGQESVPMQLTQTGPGRYEGEFDARQQGSYVLDLRYNMGSGERATSGVLQTGVSVAYSPEYRELRPNLALLEELRSRTGGRTLDKPDAAAAFDRTSLERAQARHSAWEDLIKWMVLLFLLDVAVRRIAVNPIAWAQQFMADMRGTRETGERTAAVLTTLKGKREELREEVSVPPPASETGTSPSRSARYEPAQPSEEASDDLARALDGATRQDAPVVARPTGKKPPTTEADYTARLLKAKRRARDDMKKKDQGEG